MENTVLTKKLDAIDGKDYGALQALKGTYKIKYYDLIFEQIPKDPYAPPHTGIYRIQINRNDQNMVSADLSNEIREIAFRDYLSRVFYQACQKFCAGRRGTGYSGVITINEPGQAILERSSVIIEKDIIELRCFIGLPASGRSINAPIAKHMLLNELPQIIDHTFLMQYMNREILNSHLDIAEDTENLRNQLNQLGLVAFINDGAILPRMSGSSTLPLAPDSAVPFISPKKFRVECTLPHSGTIQGMGIPAGVTLITGGGYHGKSTLLDAISMGIYNHIPGDGREYCVSNPDTIKIRAYSGRYITGTNISSFIDNLPFAKDTINFSTDNASGSTSQAAGIVEALESGAKTLLMDEDTCATNFMIRDHKMQQLVRKADEPITTYIDSVRKLYLDLGVSTILVLGGIGDYFEVADQVIQMHNYQARDVTSAAHNINNSAPVKRQAESSTGSIRISDRIPISDSIDATNHYGKVGIYAKETHRIHFGKNEIDLTDLEQIVELSQTRALAFSINYAKKYMNGINTLHQIIEKTLHDINEQGLDIIDHRISPNFACFRSHELAFVLNRLRSFRVAILLSA